MRNLKNVDYHVTDRCNLGCVSCGHFCPLVPKDTKDKDIRQIIKDLQSLYYATDKGTRLDQLTLTGGEVTLNDQLKYIIPIANSFFSNKVKLWTNGINYRKLIDIKDVIIDNNITICMSDYELPNVDNIISELGIVFGDRFYYVTRRESDGHVKFFKTFFDQNAIVPLEYRLNCVARYECNQLVDEKLYPCQYAAYFKYFDEYFKGKHALELGSDYCIDLRYVTNFEDILNFIDSCDFKLCERCIDCLPEHELQDWKISNKEMSEWCR